MYAPSDLPDIGPAKALSQEDLGQEALGYDRAQVIEVAGKDLNFLAGLAMPTVFEYLFPEMHLVAWDLVRQLLAKDRDFSKLALGIPRGHAKTTLIKLFALYCVLYTDRKFILVTSDTATKAQNIVADIIDMLNEPNILAIFGDWKLGIEQNNQEIKKFGFRGRNIIIAAIGAGGSMRGLNLKNERPDVMIFDDIQSKECSESEVQASALERWLIGTAMKAKSPKGCLYVFAGNMFPGDNCLLRKLKENPNWIKFISGAVLADGSALWPELHSMESLIAELKNDMAMGHPEIFFSEVLNDTEAGLSGGTDISKIRKWPWSAEDSPQGKAIIIDPSNANAGSDDTAIGLVELYDGKPGLRSCVSAVLSPGDTIKQALILALVHKVPVIAVENVAYQASLLYWFNEISEHLHIEGIHFVPITTGGRSKNSRILDGLKSLTSGDIYLHPEVRTLVEHQIVNFNPVKRNNKDDLLDVVSYIPKVVELYGALMVTDETVVILESDTAGMADESASSF